MLVSYTKERAPFLNSLSSSPLLDSESKPTFFRWVVTPHSRPLAESPPSDGEGSAAPLVPGMGLVYAKLQDTVQQELARMASAPAPVAAAAAVAAPVAVPVTAAAAPVAVPVAAAAAIADDEVKAEAAAALVGAKRAAASADAGSRKRPASGSAAASAPRIAPFVRKLYDMVSAGNDCIRWAQDGTSFWIGAPDALEFTVLPRFFKHNRMAFFVKQLKAYGFCAKRGASCLDVSKEWFHKVRAGFSAAQFRAIRARSRCATLPPTPPSPLSLQAGAFYRGGEESLVNIQRTSAPSRSLAANTAGSGSSAEGAALAAQSESPPVTTATAAAVAALPGGSSSSGLSGSGGVSGSVMSGSGGSGSGSGKRKSASDDGRGSSNGSSGGHDGSSGRTSSGRNSFGRNSSERTNSEGRSESRSGSNGRGSANGDSDSNATSSGRSSSPRSVADLAELSTALEVRTALGSNREGAPRPHTSHTRSPSLPSPGAPRRPPRARDQRLRDAGRDRRAPRPEPCERPSARGGGDALDRRRRGVRGHLDPRVSDGGHRRMRPVHPCA